MSDHFENDFSLEALCDVIRSSEYLPKMLNFKRYAEMLVAKKTFDELLTKNGSEKSTVSLEPTFLMGSLTAEVSDFEVRDFTAMQILLSLANNLDIYPLVNGNMCISFTFHNMMIMLQ